MDQGQTNTPHACIQQTKPDENLIGFLSVNTQDQNQINRREKGNGKTADAK
jgi:hypothetical protein